MQTAELVIYPTKEMVGRIKIPLYLSRRTSGTNGPFAKGRQYYISIEIGEGLVLYQHSQMVKYGSGDGNFFSTPAEMGNQQAVTLRASSDARNSTPATMSLAVISLRKKLFV